MNQLTLSECSKRRLDETSQCFANIYLNEMDQYAKHKLKIKYWYRYMDDMVAS